MKTNIAKDLVVVTNVERNKFYKYLLDKTNFISDERIKFVGTVYEKMKEYVIRSDFGKISEIMNLIHFAEISIAVNFFSKASSVEEKKSKSIFDQ